MRPAHFKVGPKIVAKVRRTKVQAYTSNWSAISAAIMKRDGHKCTQCGATKGLQVHHIIPVASGGRTCGYNLKTLCIHCHNKKHGHL